MLRNKKKLEFGQIPDPPLCFLQTYVDYMTRLYEREIKDFFEVAKIKMAGTSKDGKGKFGKTAIKTNYFVCLSRNSWNRIFAHAISLVSVCLVFAMLCVCHSVCAVCNLLVFFFHVTPHDKHTV